MKRYTITLHGCDDSTSWDMELKEDEVKLIERLCKLSTETSAYGCMPIMTIEESKN